MSANVMCRADGLVLGECQEATLTITNFFYQLYVVFRDIYIPCNSDRSEN